MKQNFQIKLVNEITINRKKCRMLHTTDPLPWILENMSNYPFPRKFKIDDKLNPFPSVINIFSCQKLKLKKKLYGSWSTLDWNNVEVNKLVSWSIRT